MSNAELKKELLKCKKSYFHFINHITIPVATSEKVFAELIYDKQKELVNLINEKHYIIVLKSRQVGVSLLLQTYIAWLVLFHANYNVGVISRKETEATNFAQSVLKIIESIDPKLFGVDKMDRLFRSRTKQSFVLENNSSLFVEAVSLSNPENVLRGRSIHFLVIDEGAFIRHIDKAYTGLLPATFKVHKDAMQNNIPYGIVIISTPNGINNWYYEMWRKAEEGSSMFTPFKVHYKDVPFVDENFIQEQKKMMTELQWLQEMELVFISPEDSLIPSEIITKISKTIDDKPIMRILEFKVDYIGTHTIIYKSWLKDDGQKYQYDYIVIGLDVATAYQGQSNTAFEIFGVKYEEDELIVEQIGEIIGKIPIQFTEEIVKFLVNQEFGDIKNVKFIHENNTYAVMLSERLPKIVHPSKLFYDRKKQNIRLPGFTTTAQSKKGLLDLFYWFLRDYKVFIKSSRLLNDITALKEKLTKVSDTVIATSLAFYMINDLIENQFIIRNRKNIEDFTDKILFANYPEEIQDIVDTMGEENLKSMYGENYIQALIEDYKKFNTELF